MMRDEDSVRPKDFEVGSEVFAVAAREGWSKHAWLVVGKGPSFARIAACDELRGPVVTLNHAIAALPPVRGEWPNIVAHCVDREVLEDCAAAILARANYLLLPWMPNHRHRRGRETLADMCGAVTLLSQLARENRLLWYDRTGSPRQRGTGAAVPIRFFSAEGAFGVLARSGVRTIISAGIDGGARYSSDFAHLQPLENGRASFDAQLPRLKEITQRWNVHWRRLPAM